MNEEFVKSLVLAVVGSGLFSGGIAAIVNTIHDRNKSRSNKEEARDQAIMFLLASSIRNECQSHINEGEIDVEDLNRLEKAWTIYHDDLGGNGFLNTVMSSMRKLPIKKINK